MTQRLVLLYTAMTPYNQETWKRSVAYLRTCINHSRGLVSSDGAYVETPYALPIWSASLEDLQLYEERESIITDTLIAGVRYNIHRVAAQTHFESAESRREWMVEELPLRLGIVFYVDLGVSDFMKRILREYEGVVTPEHRSLNFFSQWKPEDAEVFTEAPKDAVEPVADPFRQKIENAVSSLPDDRRLGAAVRKLSTGGLRG